LGVYVTFIIICLGKRDLVSSTTAEINNCAAPDSIITPCVDGVTSDGRADSHLISSHNSNRRCRVATAITNKSKWCVHAWVITIVTD